jgi:hypothetical protein
MLSTMQAAAQGIDSDAIRFTWILEEFSTLQIWLEFLSVEHFTSRVSKPETLSVDIE